GHVDRPGRIAMVDLHTVRWVGVGIDLDQLDVGDFDEYMSWDLAVAAETDGTIVGQLSVHPTWGRY
ncbi:MAG: hypothetical protein CSA63_01920, partial [Propionibacterium sp.]